MWGGSLRWTWGLSMTWGVTLPQRMKSAATNRQIPSLILGLGHAWGPRWRRYFTSWQAKMDHGGSRVAFFCFVSCSNSFTFTLKAALVYGQRWGAEQEASFEFLIWTVNASWCCLRLLYYISCDCQAAAACESSCRMAFSCLTTLQMHKGRPEECGSNVEAVKASNSSFSSISFAWVRACWWSSFWPHVWHCNAPTGKTQKRERERKKKKKDTGREGGREEDPLQSKALRSLKVKQNLQISMLM